MHIKPFSQLKEAMSSPQMLALPKFSEPFIFESDARGTEVCVVLKQNQRPRQGQEFQYSPRLQKHEGYALILGSSGLNFALQLSRNIMP